MAEKCDPDGDTNGIEAPKVHICDIGTEERGDVAPGYYTLTSEVSFLHIINQNW
jgi:hypothetical protein